MVKKQNRELKAKDLREFDSLADLIASLPEGANIEYLRVLEYVLADLDALWEELNANGGVKFVPVGADDDKLVMLEQVVFTIELQFDRKDKLVGAWYPDGSSAMDYRPCDAYKITVIEYESEEQPPAREASSARFEYHRNGQG